MPRAGRGPGVPVGIVLAGGQSRRMGGGDKCLRPLAGRPILAHVIERARPQVAALALNANGDPRRFAGFGLPVVADSIAGFAGPLAGVLAGLDWAATLESRRRPMSRALPATRRSCRAISSPGSARRWPTAHDIACAASGGPASIRSSASGRWRCARTSRQRWRSRGSARSINGRRRFRLAVVEFPAAPLDPFFNANRPEDLAEAERLAALEAAG